MVEHDPFERIPESNKPQFDEITRKIQGIKREWKSALDYEERRDLLANAACLQSQDDSDWQALKDWMYAKLPEGDPTKKPGKRCWFIKSPAGYFEAALQWKRKHGTRTPPRTPPPPSNPQPETTAEDKAALAEFLSKPARTALLPVAPVRTGGRELGSTTHLNAEGFAVTEYPDGRVVINPPEP